jgi:hypothetical protein
MFEKYGVKNRTMLLLKAIKEGELQVIDMGFFNILGQYQEDLQIVDLKSESGQNDCCGSDRNNPSVCKGIKKDRTTGKDNKSINRRLE